MIPSPSPQAVRHGSRLILSLYALPPVLVLILAFTWSDALPGLLPTLTGIVGLHLVWRICLLLAKAGPGRWKKRAEPVEMQSIARNRPLPERRRLAISAEFPELADLDFAIVADRENASTDGRQLKLGQNYLPQTTRPLGDELFFALAHEARHLAVGTFRELRLFRLIRTPYLLVALAAYFFFLINWVALADDPNRLVFAGYLALFPFWYATLRVVLDEAMAGFEWRLELDADQAAHERCAAAGRQAGTWYLRGKLHILRRKTDAYPPPLLYMRAGQGHVPSRLLIKTILGVGLLNIIAPFVTLLLLIAMSDRPDGDKALIGLINIGTLLIAAAALAAATRLRPDPGAAPVGQPMPEPLTGFAAASVLAARIHAIAADALAFILGGFAIFLGIGTTLTLAMAPSLEALETVAMTAIPVLMAVCLFKAVRNSGSAVWRIAGMVSEWGWLTGFAWVIRGTDGLGHSHDPHDLGLAMQENGVAIYYEMLRLWHEQLPQLELLATACALFVLLVGFLADNGRQIRARYNSNRPL